MSMVGSQRMGSSPPERFQPSTSYGKACLNCVKSKTRCANASGGGKCERCLRLNKDCLPAPTVRQKRVVKRQTSSKNTAALEEKLDGIVQMLQRSGVAGSGVTLPQGSTSSHDLDSIAFTDRTLITSGGTAEHHTCNSRPTTPYEEEGIAILRPPPSSDSPPATQATIEPPEKYFGGVHHSVEIDTCFSITEQQKYNFPFNPPPTPASSKTSRSIDLDSPLSSTKDSSKPYPLETERELEEYLEAYRMHMVPNFPVVCIRPETTMASLQVSRPFLSLVIRTICNKNLRRQSALVIEVKKYIGKEMLLEGTRSMDLFLGVLVFASWFHLGMHNKRPIVSTMMHLAMALAADLGIMRNWSPNREPLNVMKQHIAYGFPSTLPEKPPITMEKRRAAVGLFLITSVTCTYFQRIELMAWTPYLEECLNLLSTCKDYETDTFLVLLVRVQLICNKAAAQNMNVAFTDANSPLAIELYLKTLASNLDDLQRSIPLEWKENPTLKLHILNTSLTIHSHIFNSPLNLSKPLYNDPTTPFNHLTHLSTCFTSIKSWFSLFLSTDIFPLISYQYFSMAIFAYMAHCIIGLYRLSTFDSEGMGFLWDKAAVRRELDLGEVVGKLTDRWGEVPKISGMISDLRGQGMGGGGGEWRGGCWEHTRLRTGAIKRWWEAKVAAEKEAEREKEKLGNVNLVYGNGSENGAAATATMDGSVLPVVQNWDQMDLGPMNINMVLDNSWMTEFMGEGYDFNMEPYP